MCEGTRFGSPVRSRKDVREPDAYDARYDGKIKGAARPCGKSLSRNLHFEGAVGRLACRDSCKQQQ